MGLKSLEAFPVKVNLVKVDCGVPDTLCFLTHQVLYHCALLLYQMPIQWKFPNLDLNIQQKAISLLQAFHSRSENLIHVTVKERLPELVKFINGLPLIF